MYNNINFKGKGKFSLINGAIWWHETAERQIYKKNKIRTRT